MKGGLIIKYQLVNYVENPSKNDPNKVYITLSWISEKLPNGNNEVLVNQLEKSKFQELLQRNGFNSYQDMKKCYMYVDNYFNFQYRSNNCVSFQKV